MSPLTFTFELFTVGGFVIDKSLQLVYVSVLYRIEII